MAQFLPLLLFLHVMGAILAFGPTFAYSIMGAMAGREPQHANFSARQVGGDRQQAGLPAGDLPGRHGRPADHGLGSGPRRRERRGSGSRSSCTRSR